MKKWVESHTPDEIRIANNARRLLRRKQPNASRKYPLIADDRQPKMPTSAMLYFMRAKRASGDMKGMKLSEATTLLSQEWKQLPASERKVCKYPLNASAKELTNPSHSRMLQPHLSNDTLRKSRRYITET
jgi:hypothetical protein